MAPDWEDDSIMSPPKHQKLSPNSTRATLRNISASVGMLNRSQSLMTLPKAHQQLHAPILLHWPSVSQRYRTLTSQPSLAEPP